MKHPAYHLRPNKAVDRILFLEAVRRLGRLDTLESYTYYGLGGPYLEDFRLLYESCPEIKLVSIEKNEATYKRQNFHRPCGAIELRTGDFRSMLGDYSPVDEKSIFWLDFTTLTFGNFEDFMVLLGRVVDDSMIKVSLRCEASDFFDGPEDQVGAKAELFQRKFGEIMPNPSSPPPRERGAFARLVQDMLQIAAQKALPGGMAQRFHLVSSFYYSDGAGMLTLTGVVSERGSDKRIRNAFKDLPFKNLTWKDPVVIDVPVLSTKERLHLEQYLPCTRNAGRSLTTRLGYLIDGNQRKTERKLKKYAEFHRFYPYFMRANP